MLTPTEFSVIIGSALVCALLAVFAMKRSQPNQDGDVVSTDPIAFLFDDGVLHHATNSALTSFAMLPGAHVWDDLRNSLLARFPQFPETATSQSIGSMTMLPRRKDDPGLVTLQWRDSLCWVELTEERGSDARHRDPAERSDTLQQASDTSPHPTWETLSNGDVGWRNPAYDALAQTCNRDDGAALFPTPPAEGSERVHLCTGPDQTECFEVASYVHADGMLHHATSVTHLIHVEGAQRTFVQTLAKTFAQLSIGLAIFDRKGQLSIFNPALVDLCRLEPQFLAGQPTMLSFFDAMRENRQMPEPKNYNAWRNDLAAMITAAADGKYHETWTLEDGRTYTVQGRPHPDGATAFLIEDISAEVSLTRNYRAEIDHYEALLNTIEDALVVFSATGVVTYSNTAYRQMWGQNPEAAFADVTVADAITQWQTKAEAEWAEMSDYIKTLGSKARKTVKVLSGPDQIISAHMMALGSDATLIRFEVAQAQAEFSLNATG